MPAPAGYASLPGVQASFKNNSPKEQEQPFPCACEGGCPQCTARRSVRADAAGLGRTAGQIKNSAPEPAGNEPGTFREPAAGEGKRLPGAMRAPYESLFKEDFSVVQVHDYARAAESAQNLGARAYTVGNHIVFNQNEFRPQNEAGRGLLAHELTHVAQQRRSGTGPRVQRWAASVHQNITSNVILSDWPKAFSEDARTQLAFFSGQLDQRTCNYLYYLTEFILPKTPILGPIFSSKSVPIISPPVYALAEYEAANHGEANRYKKENTDPKTGKGLKTEMNEERMYGYAKDALEMAGKQGITKSVLIALGLALHVGQDRGSHLEGLAGEGHDRKKAPDGSKWKTDDPNVNQDGYTQVAYPNTKLLIEYFYNKLTPSLKEQLASVKLASLAESTAGLPKIDTPKGLEKGPPAPAAAKSMYYVVLKRDMFKDPKGLPKRLFGMFPMEYQLGVGETGGKYSAFYVDAQVGLRLMQLNPYVYVDAMLGTTVGKNVKDDLMFGISKGINLGITAGKFDVNLMLNHISGITGMPDIFIMGLGARW